MRAASTRIAATAFAGVVHRFDEPGDGLLRLWLEQGIEMGRPSRIRLEIDMEPLVDASELRDVEEAEPETGNTMADYTRETQFLIALSRRTGFPVSGLRLSVVMTVDLPDVARQELSTERRIRLRYRRGDPGAAG